MSMKPGSHHKEIMTPSVEGYDLPDPPDWLDEIGATEWTRIVSAMDERSMVTKLDTMVLALYCHAYADMCEVNAWIKANGGIAECAGADSDSKHYKLFKARERLASRLQTLSGKIGITPTDRKKVAGMQSNQRSDSPMSAYTDRAKPRS